MIATGMSKKFSHIPASAFLMDLDNSEHAASLGTYKRSGNSFAIPTKAATKAATVEDNQELIKNIERSQREAEDLEGKIFNAQGEAYEREAKQIMGDYYESARV